MVWITLGAFSAEEKMGELQKEKNGVRNRHLTGAIRDAAAGPILCPLGLCLR
jgi:hypothetical protein